MMADNMMPFFFIGIMAAITIPIVVWAILNARERTREFSDVALQVGFKFLGNTWRGPVLSPVHKTCIIQRTRGKFSNAMMGSSGGLDVTLFDYTYPMGKSTVTLTLASFIQERALPPFELRGENIFDRIGEVFVHRDIDFASNPEFSRRYFLRSPDEAGTRTLFTPSLLTYLEQIPPEEKWHVETSGQTVVVYQYRQLPKAAEIPSFLDQSAAIVRTILDAANKGGFSAVGRERPVDA
jgi:hypothetical protein